MNSFLILFSIFVLLYVCLLLIVGFSLSFVFRKLCVRRSRSAPSPELPPADLPDPYEVITAEKRYEMYVQTRKQNEDFAQRNSEGFEKAMIALSSGGLGISISLLGLMKGKVMQFGLLMPTTWCLFALSLGMMIWSFQASHDAYDRNITMLDRMYFLYSEETNPLRERPRLISNAGVLFFFLGIANLCVFGLLNWNCIGTK